MTCQRLEAEEMLGFLGEKMDPHIDECPDCREARASYARITAALARDSTRPVPDDWMEGMKAKLAMKGLTGTWPRLPRPSRVERSGARLGWWLGGACSLAASVAAVVFFVKGAAVEPDMVASVEEGATTYRSVAEATTIGDVLRVRASSGDADHFELRVYLDGEQLVLRCPGASSPACQAEDDGVSAAFTFDTPGKYDLYWLLSDSTISPPVGSLDLDMEAAFGAGARIHSKKSIPVD